MPYYHLRQNIENRVALNANSLANNVELDEAVVTVIPTHGAIARQHLMYKSAGKVLMTLKYGNKSVPFGAIVTHGENKNGSIVAENGRGLSDWTSTVRGNYRFHGAMIKLKLYCRVQAS